MIEKAEFRNTEPRQHVCTVCSKFFTWNEHCAWFGRYGSTLTHDCEIVLAKVCSEKCKKDSKWMDE